MVNILAVTLFGLPRFHHLPSGFVPGTSPFDLFRKPLVIVVLFPVIPHSLFPGSCMKKPRIPATPMPTCVMFCIMDSGRLMPTRANMAAKDAQLEGSFNRFRIMSMVISFVKLVVTPGSALCGIRRRTRNDLGVDR